MSKDETGTVAFQKWNTTNFSRRFPILRPPAVSTEFTNGLVVLGICYPPLTAQTETHHDQKITTFWARIKVGITSCSSMESSELVGMSNICHYQRQNSLGLPLNSPESAELHVGVCPLAALLSISKPRETKPIPCLLLRTSKTWVVGVMIHTSPLIKFTADCGQEENCGVHWLQQPRWLNGAPSSRCCGRCSGATTEPQDFASIPVP